MLGLALGVHPTQEILRVRVALLVPFHMQCPWQLPVVCSYRLSGTVISPDGISVLFLAPRPIPMAIGT